jgi:hypothetical protein
LTSEAADPVLVSHSDVVVLRDAVHLGSGKEPLVAERNPLVFRQLGAV